TVLGCGDRPLPPDDDADDIANDGDAKEPDAMAEGVVGDPWNCGESGAKCIGPMGIGDCIDDECQGRLSSCRLGGTTCDVLCGNEGGVCAEDRCEGVTAFGWSLTSVEHSETMCTLADKKTATALTIGCADPLPFETFPGVRCCCKALP